MASLCADIPSENSNYSMNSSTSSCSFNLHEAVGAISFDNADTSPKKIAFGSPSKSCDRSPSPPTTIYGRIHDNQIKEFDLFEDRPKSSFPGVFGTNSKIEVIGKFQITPKEPLQLFPTDSISSHWNPSKRLKNNKEPSPNDVVLINAPMTPFSGGFQKPFGSPGSRAEEYIFSSRPTMIEREESLINIEQSRLAHDFDIVDVIGTGVFGTVYRARGRLDNVMYAVKRSKRFKGHMAKEKMMHEVHALAALSSQEDADKTITIVRYYSAWIEDDHICIQMELCDASVDGLLMTAHQFDKREVFHLLRDVLLALELLHSNDFVHLDIKPANILKKNSRYKLGDFGLALRTDHGKAGGAVEEGDSRYMAKELLGWGSVPDLTKCDIFSLGITVLELASGQVVAANGPDWQSLRLGLQPDSPHLQNVPADLSEVIRRLMAAAPEDRPTAHTCLQSFPKLKSDLELELQFFRARASDLTRALNGNRDSLSGPDSKKLKRVRTMGTF